MTNSAEQGIVTSGVVAFSNITEYDEYKGQSTGRYKLTITLDPQTASTLEDMGVKIKTYVNKETGKEALQRAFYSKYKIDVLDMAGHPVSGELPYGSKVRLLWKPSDVPHPQHGTGTYLNKVRVVEFAEHEVSSDLPEEF